MDNNSLLLSDSDIFDMIDSSQATITFFEHDQQQFQTSGFGAHTQTEENFTAADIQIVPARPQSVIQRTEASHQNIQPAEQQSARLFRPIDFFFVVMPATTSAHQDLIFMLLNPTREHFRMLTEEQPPGPIETDSYLSQWLYWQTILTHFWAASERKNEPTPRLVRLLDISPGGIVWTVPIDILGDVQSLTAQVFGVAREDIMW